MTISKLTVLLGFILWQEATQIILAQSSKQVMVYDFDGRLLADYKAKSLSQCKLFATELQEKYRKQGFIACSVDTLYSLDSVYIIRFFKGTPYYIKNITINDPFQLYVKRLKYKQNQLFTLKYYNELSDKLTQTYQNNGFPLVNVKSNNRLYANELDLTLTIEPGSKFKFDEITCTGNLIHNQALSALIGIATGDVYNQRKLNEIKTTISNTGYLQFDSLQVNFKPDGNAKLNLKVTGLKTNSISGIIGLATSSEKKTSITGEVNFNLINILKQGEYLNLAWRKTGVSSQYLNLESEYPFIGGKNIGIAGGIEIDKQDTTFFTTEWNTGLVTRFKRSFRVVFNFSKFKSNRIDSVDNQLGLVKNWQYGCKLMMNRTNFWLNPSKGYILNAEIRLGQHSLKSGDQKKSDISKFRINGSLFLPINRSAIVLSNNSAVILADTLYKNELFRVGGESTLRGVNDRSIFASAFSTWSLEYRWLYEKFSNAYIFAEYAWVSDNPSLKNYDKRYALGSGLHLNTKAGLVSVSYAIGNIIKNAPNPSDGIIHVGLISRF